jgi:hypothetical protein
VPTVNWDQAGINWDQSTVTWDGTQSGGGGSTSTTPQELEQALCTKAGTSLKLGGTYAANVIAGTTNMPMVGALNIKAGNPPSAYRELTGVLNQLAGTSGWGNNAAASRWAGVY